MADVWTSKLGNRFPRALIDKLDGEHHRILQQLRKQPANSRCAECGDIGTTWASVNIGVFLCVGCSDVHRGLGTHISKVKGCSGTYLWGPDEIRLMQEKGNAVVNTQFGGGSAGARPAANASKEDRMNICRRKYEQRVWAQPERAVSMYSGSHAAPGAPSVPTALTSVNAAVLADSHTSLIDDLFKDFDAAPPKQEEPESARTPCLIKSVPCIIDEVDRPAARPARAGHQGESAWFDELLNALDLARKDNVSNDASTAASEDEGVPESKIPADSSLVPSMALGVDTAIVSSNRPRIDESTWANFGDW